jgi:predicted dehydrogenase
MGDMLPAFTAAVYVNDSMNTLSVGIVGAGIIAREAHLPVLRCMPDIRVAWICDVSNHRAKMLANANGLAAVDCGSPDKLPPCDLALLAIPVGARAEYLRCFAARGISVLAEKPFALSAEEHEHLIGEFEPYGLACGYMRRFYASTQLLKRLIGKRTLGSLKAIRISEGARSTGSRVDTSYLDDPRQCASGGILSELGCHSLDVALHVTGASNCEIDQAEFVFDSRTDRRITARLRLLDSPSLSKSGATLEYCVSWLDQQLNMMIFEFDSCCVWMGIKPDATIYLGGSFADQDAVALVPASGAATTVHQAFYLQWRAFIDGVRANSASEISAASALLSTRVIERLYAVGRQCA